MESWGYFGGDRKPRVFFSEAGGSSKDGISVVWARVGAGGISVVMESRGRGVNEISVVWARIEGWG